MPRRTEYDRKRLNRLRSEQWQVITRAQALSCGMPSSTIDDRIRNGDRWQALLPGVYLTVTGAVTQEHREVAALLYAGAGSVITGPCAVRRHRLTSAGSNTVDVLVPLKVRRTSTGFVRLCRTKRMPRTYWSSGPLRFVHPARAVADAARKMNNLDDVRTVVYEAIQRTKCTLEDLLAELRDGPAQRCSPLRAVLAEIATGIRSHAENDLRLLIKRSKAPKPVYNAKLFTLDGIFIAMVDAWWDDAGVAAEVDSRAYHTKHDEQDRDRNRHDLLIMHGVFPLHFSPHRIHHDGDGVLGEIESGVAHGRKRPLLPIIVLPPDAEWDENWAAKARAMAASRSRAPGTKIPAGALA